MAPLWRLCGASAKYSRELLWLLRPERQEPPLHILCHHPAVASLRRRAAAARPSAVLWFLELEVGEHHGRKTGGADVVGLASAISGPDLVDLEVVLLPERLLELLRGLVVCSSVSELSQTWQKHRSSLLTIAKTYLPHMFPLQLAAPGTKKRYSSWPVAREEESKRKKPAGQGQDRNTQEQPRWRRGAHVTTCSPNRLLCQTPGLPTGVLGLLWQRPYS